MGNPNQNGPDMIGQLIKNLIDLCLKKRSKKKIRVFIYIFIFKI